MSNDWILSSTGIQVFPFEFTREMANEEDIIHSLSNTCRWSGHCFPYYSVAEHSVLVSRLVQKWNPGNHRLALAALWHDAHEAYIGDIPKPLKGALRVALGGGEFLRWEQLEFHIQDCIDRAIYRRMSTERFNTDIKIADQVLMATEKKLLMPPAQDSALDQCYLDKCEPLSDEELEDLCGWGSLGLAPMDAKALFMNEHQYLVAEHRAKRLL